MPRLTIDGRPVEVPQGATVLDAAKSLGIRIPTLCHVEGFPPSASCFLCAVQVGGRAGLSPSCALPAADGMVVETDTADVRASRKMALELLLSDHAGDCIAPCRTGCPARLDIPAFTTRITAGDDRGAAEVVQDFLTLPAALGRVCPRLCEERCRRCDLEEAVSIGNLHRYAADRDLASPSPRVPPREAPTGKRAAIVGAGPAGLAAAHHLLRRGHGATIFDAHPLPGGMLRYGIPEFRLPRKVLDAEIATIAALGGELRMGKALGRDFSLDDLRRDFDAVFLALGAQGSRGLDCPGEELATPAIRFLEEVAEGRRPAVGDRVLVIGGGNTAMDACRTAVRLGASTVKVLYRRTRREMPCLMAEVEAAEAEGVAIDYLVAPTRLERKGEGLLLTCIRMELGAPDASGRARPVPVAGSEFTVEASCVIAAIGQTVDASAAAAGGARVGRWGIAVDPKTLATSIPGVFAGGDAVTGADLAVRAVAAGRLAAASMDQYLGGRKVEGDPELLFVLMEKLDDIEMAELYRGIEEAPRTRMTEIPIERRRTSFDEVELGFTAGQARTEAGRCMSCGCIKQTSCFLRQLATEYNADTLRFGGDRRRFRRDVSSEEVVYEPGKCILCGACVKAAAEAGEELGLAIVGRGFDAAVGVPFGKPMSEGLRKAAAKAAAVCPTGAIAIRGEGCGCAASCSKRR